MTLHLWIPAATLPRHRALLAPGVEVHDLPDDGPLPERLGPGQFLVAAMDRLRLQEVIGRIDDLRVIQTMSAGVDRLVDLVPPGVVLCDGSGIHDVAVAEWVVMTILASRRNLPRHLASQREGTWLAGPDGGGDDLEDATVLIVGHGSIGRAVEARLAPFGPRILRVALHEREGVSPSQDLPSLLPHADVVVLLLPLTPATLGLVDAAFLARMAPGALLVNASRGSIADTEALTAALLEGRIRAALDVTDPEPLPVGHPMWSAPGLLITPHIGGWVRRRLDRAWRLVAAQVDSYMSGAPLRNIVVEGY